MKKLFAITALIIAMSFFLDQTLSISDGAAKKTKKKKPATFSFGIVDEKGEQSYKTIKFSWEWVAVDETTLNCNLKMENRSPYDGEATFMVNIYLQPKGGDKDIFDTQKFTVQAGKEITHTIKIKNTDYDDVSLKIYRFASK